MSVFLYKNIFCLGNEDTKLLPNKEQNYTVVPKNVNKENLNASKNDRFLKVYLNWQWLALTNWPEENYLKKEVIWGDVIAIANIVRVTKLNRNKSLSVKPHIKVYSHV